MAIGSRREIGQCTQGFGIVNYGCPDSERWKKQAGGGGFRSISGSISGVVDQLAIVVEDTWIGTVGKEREVGCPRDLLDPSLDDLIASDLVQKKACDVDVDCLVVLDCRCRSVAGGEAPAFVERS